MCELPNYDEWKLAGQADHIDLKSIGRCCICKCNVLENDDRYEMEDGDIICVDCAWEYMARFRKVGA